MHTSSKGTKFQVKSLSFCEFPIGIQSETGRDQLGFRLDLWRLELYPLAAADASRLVTLITTDNAHHDSEHIDGPI